MHGWLIEKNYNHSFKILLYLLQYLKNENKTTYYGRKLTREFYALSIQKRIYMYLCDHAKEKRRRIKFMCAQVSFIYNSSLLSFTSIFFPSSVCVYIYTVHRASKMLYKILHRMMVDIVKTTKRIYLYTTVSKCKKLFFEICTDFFLFFFFFYHSTIVRMNEFHVGYAHWFR